MVGIVNCITNGRKWLKRKILRKIEMETKNLTYNIPSNAQTFVVTFTAFMRDNLGVSDMFNLNPDFFNSLRVLLVSPSTSGAVRLTEDATRPCYYEIIDSQDLHIHLSELVAGVHRLTIISVYGTYTKSLLTVDVVVPTEAGNKGAPIYIDVQTVNALVGVHAGDFTSLQDEVDEAKEEIAGKADGSIYQVGVSGEEEVEDVAKILGHGLEVGQNAVATGLHAVAIGDARVEGDMSIANGYIYPGISGSEINASGIGSHACGAVGASNSRIVANSGGSVARGEIGNDNCEIDTDGAGSTAIGCIYDDYGRIVAEADGSCAFGVVENENGEIYATGNSSLAHGTVLRSYGTIEASGEGSYAGGIADNDYGDIMVSGDASFAHGKGVYANANCQFVVGRANKIDEEGEFAFIVGNGTSDSNRSNAFAITWEGNLVLYNHGVEIVMTPAELERLINLLNY